jgi:hypothetical protein
LLEGGPVFKSDSITNGVRLAGGLSRLNGFVGMLKSRGGTIEVLGE